MRRYFSIQWVTGILLLLLINNRAWAAPAPGVDPPVLKTLEGSKGQLKVDSSVVVEDAKFFNAAYNGVLIKPYPVKNLISFEINEEANIPIPENFDAWITLGITITKADNSVQILPDQTLYVGYNNQNIYGNRNVFVFDNAYRVEVKVKGLKPGINPDIWKLLKVVNQLQAFPQYNFDCTGNAVTTIHDSAWAPNTSKDELPVYWPPSIGADEYDLEWTYIDSSELASGLYGAPASPDATMIFDNNASRVTITGTAYKIPLIYDNKGHLFYRVRPVQWQANKGRTEANWSSIFTGGLGRFDYNGHERPLNWQATTTFAEEGKRKSVVQYYDGSLRARQTVTKDNSTEKTIVAESFYDYQGRPVIQVLPAPTLNSVIGYSKNFNRGLNTATGYDKSLFDTLVSADMYCNVSAPPMDVSGGAAQYYSPANPMANEGFHKYIPDAKGYPFTEVEYTPDNTGRISRQSGVGETFRLGSGHETSYFYGTPGQRELDALFGTEVGIYSHYFKTMVRDANGQYSVSYTDMHGRTVATALSGAVPDSIKLDTLSSYRSALLTEDLSGPATTVIKDLVMESKKGLLVSKGGDHIFTYQLGPQSLQMENCTHAQICYECLYDLEITITDDCNNQKLGGAPFDTVVHNFQIAAIDTICNNGGFSFSFTKFLPEGSYEITKKLSVSRYGLDHYRDSLYMKTNTCKSLDTFIQEQRQVLAAVMQCRPTCQSCNDSLGTWEQFRERFRVRSGIAESDMPGYDSMARTAYNKAKEDCNALCDSAVSEFNDVRRNMLMDMTPSSGQYANLDRDDDVLSVFFSSIDGQAPDTTAKYTQVTYRDANGNPDMVYDEIAGKLVPPQQLSPGAFAQKFKLSWAESLLPFHPEYCKLQQYELLKGSLEWDKRFAETDTYAEALAKGYLNPIRDNTIPTRFTGGQTDVQDPLSTFNNNAFQSRLKDSLLKYRNISSNTFVSLYSVASMTVMCKDGADNSTCLSNYININNAFNTTAMCTGELDMAWRAFRQMYLDIKRQITNQWINSQCTNSLTATALMAKGFSPKFGDAGELNAATGAGLPQDTTQAKNKIAQQMAGYYDANCRAYATQWMQQLSSCTLYPADSITNVIIPRLVQVCKEGSDADHPYGASSVKPSSTNTFKSFEEVINNYNQTHGITDYINCNAWRITAPKKYDQQAVFGNKPIYTKPSDCECSAITAYYNKYKGSSGYSSFADYLKKTYNTNVSDSALNLMLGLCKVPGVPTATCSYVSAPLFLPPVFQCYTGDICIACEQFRAADQAFRTQFPGIYPMLGATTDSIQARNNRLYESFMNYRFGFSKRIDEYLDFAKSCGMPVDSTNALLDIAKGFNTSRNNSYGVKISFSTQDGELFTNLRDLVHNGAIQLPDTVRARPGQWYNNVGVYANGGNFSTTNGYAIEFRMKFLRDLLSGNVFYMNGGFGLVVSRFVSSQTIGGVIYAPGIYLTGITSDNNHQYGYEYGSALFVYKLISSDPEAILDWNNYKVKVTLNDVSFYVNNALIIQIPRDPTALTCLYAFGLGLRGRQGAVDWIKLYDQNDQVHYFEDFLDADNPVLGDPAFRCRGAIPDCQSSFVQYFNQQKGTSYTFNQIDSLYASHGINLNICGSGNIPCDTLSLLQSNFKNECSDTAYWTISRYLISCSGGCTNVYDQDVPAISEVFNSGIAHLPARYDNLTNKRIRLTLNKQVPLSAAGLVIEARVKLPKNAKNISLYDLGFGVVTNTNVYYASFYQLDNSTYHPGYNLIENISPGFSAEIKDVYLLENNIGHADPNFLRSFDDWKVLKIKIANNRYYVYYDNILIHSIGYSGDVQNIQKCLFDFKGHDGSIDYIKIYDTTGKSYYEQNFYGCSGCQTSYVQYFNEKRNANYSPDQINAMYGNCSITSSVCEPSCTFQKTYGGSGTDVANDMQVTADQGHIIAGNTTSFGNGGMDAYILKTDKKGDVLWSKTYGGSNDETFNRIKPTSDGGYIAVGYTRSFHQAQREMFVVKTDASGNVIWSKGLAQNTSGGEVAYDMIQTSDGGYAVIGTYNLVSGGADWEVIRLAADGSVIWGKRLGSTNTDEGFGVLEDNDTLVVTGVVNSSDIGNPSTYYDGCILKLNKANGNVNWIRTYDVNTPKQSWFGRISKRGTGYRIMVNASDNWEDTNPRLVTLDVDRNGTVTGLKRSPLVRNHTDPNHMSMYPTADGGFIAAMSDMGVNSDISLSRTNAAGNVQWTNLIKQSGNQYVNKVVENVNGSYTATGTSDSDIVLINVTPAGKSNCDDSTALLSNDSIGYIIYANSALDYNVALTFSNTAISVTGVDAATNVNSICLTGNCFTPGPTLCGRAEPVFPPMTLQEINNCSDSSFFIASKAQELYQVYIDSLKGHFDSSYIARCLEAYKVEQFTVRHRVNEFHYTLYYYDQAGNLIKTVPPAGVRANYDSLWLDSVATARAAGAIKTPKHTLITQYRYNTLNQAVSQKSPDGGKTGFWYDRLGRLVISQNAKQKAVAATENGRQYSYTLYDYLGRITEVGQLGNATGSAMTDEISRNPLSLDSWITGSAGNKEQITQTVYDLPYTGFPGISTPPINQYNLRNRVSYTTFTAGSNPAQYNQGTFYSYDIHGNVDTLLQDYGNSEFAPLANIMNRHNMRFKTFMYDYDLISGKVNRVQYQPGYADGWIHRYSYDAENRLTKVETSSDDYSWETEARYEYYRHGPLARMVLGHQQVQGVDYAYTLQGWLKGVNSITLDATHDIGNDGLPGGLNQYVARDALGFGLNYFTGDYKPVSAGMEPFPGYSCCLPAGAYKPLYNGNISSIAKTNAKLGEFSWTFGGTVFYNYGYDQLNRLTKMDAFNGFRADSNTWKYIHPLDIWKERISYDANGNIQKYLRNGADGGGYPVQMDSLTYNYYAGTNQLRRIHDSVPAGVYPNVKEFSDLDDQPDNNYTYDEIGNLIRDSSEGITGIKWSVYGKILEISKRATSPSAATRMIFTYDAQGNRIGKTTEYAGNNNKQYDWYVRDAQGNPIAIYSANGSMAAELGSITPSVSEWHIYGSSLLGTYNNPVGMNNGPVEIKWTSNFTYARGARRYQLSNHLGNVEAVITDKKFGVVSDTNSSLIAYYKPDIYMAQDYYPFGWQMPGRGWQAQQPLYRYGFNGKENDNEVKGYNGQQDYGMRIYDPRVGRFLSVDPLTKEYPWYTPFQYAGNKPVWKRDIDGMEEEGEDVFEEHRERIEEEERREELEKLRASLRETTPEEEAKNRREIEEWEKETPAARGRRFWDMIRAYGRNAFESAQTTFSPEQKLQAAMRQFNINKLQFQINKQNAKAFEGIVTTTLKNTTNAKVAKQVTLLVTGQLNGQNVSVRIRIDNITNINGVVDLIEAKYSVEQITIMNVTRTLTDNQKTAFEIFTNGTNVNIFARGENARAAGLKPGENITGKINEIKVVTNSTSSTTSQPKTVKTINVKATPSFQNKID